MNLRALSPALIFIAAFGASALADSPVILTIDDSDPSAVVITATGLAAENDDSSTSTYDGADLLQFFTTAVASSANGAAVGDLVPAGATGTPYNYIGWDADDARGSYLDLNLYAQSAITETQVFSTGTAAFTGSITMDLSSLAGELPAAGTQGNVVAGWSANEGQVIGSYEVVPEPSPSCLFCLGLAGLAVWRRAAARIRQAAR